jgi:predicted transcriptional regulator of viral defense system
MVEQHRVRRGELLKLARARVVTTSELARLLGTTSRRAAKTAYELRRRGFLSRVGRGVYASVPLDAEAGKFRADPFLAVYKALGEGFAFSHYSALNLLGGEQQIRRDLHVLSPGVRPRTRHVGEQVVHVHAIPPELWEEATTRVRRGQDRLRVTSPEWTLLGLASLPGRPQDYVAALEAFKNLLPKTDPTVLLRAAQTLQGVSAQARLGHLLSKSSENSAEFNSVLAFLERSVHSASPTYLGTRPGRPGNSYDSKFRVVYPGGR